MGVRVVVGDGESVQEAFRRLKKAMYHASIQYELDWHAYYISPGEHRRAAKGRAKRKARAWGWRRQWGAG